MDRQFTSGSRQAPDPFDQFLEEHNFYRKHTARDSSCLFRVISEQIYDTQMHHLEIRKMCVRYMRKHSEFFQKLVERELDEYLDDMSKPKTYGTLLELQALGYLYQRNVILFEPFNLGNYYNNRLYFNDVFRVFYTPERHFDSVFTCDYIKDAAICQSIIYEILYKEVYKLPDVSYAVEYMLHLATFEEADCHAEYDAKGYCTSIQLPYGQTFNLNLPENTNCILENYKLCHFHYTNFPRFSDELQRELYISTNRDEIEKSALNKTAESFLPNKYVSCVRQLLEEGITPFPYKVAKALDPNMYRNIEFDAWNEARKEQKLQNWYNGDTNFKVGAKCHVKLCKSENNLYTCHIQEMALDKGYCIVFVEQLGEKRLVPYESLIPLPPEQFKPWALPYRFQRQLHKCGSMRLTRHYNYRLKFNGQFSETQEYCSSLPHLKNNYCDMAIAGDGDENDYDSETDIIRKHFAVEAAAHHQRKDCYYKLKQFTHLENFRTHTVEYCAMPLTVHHPGSARDLDSRTGHRTILNENQLSAPPPQSLHGNTNATGEGSEENVKGEFVNGHGIVNATSSELVEHPFVGAYMPEFQCFYPMPQYGAIPDEYYGFVYDTTMPPPPINAAGPAAYMPPANGTLYYMCNGTGAPGSYAAVGGNNPFIQAPSPLQAPQSFIATTSLPGDAAGNAGYCSNAYYGHGNIAGASVAPLPPQTTPSAYNSSMLTRSRGQFTATPLSARINFDAKKSMKPNGADLPPDVATLRYFYNLGLDCQHHHGKCKNNDDGQVTKLEENASHKECISDANNNANSYAARKNSNANLASSSSSQNYSHSYVHVNHKQQNQPRRFTSRYFNNNKDRQNYRNNNNGNANNTSVGDHHMQRNNGDININTKGAASVKADNISNGTPNSSRPHHLENSNNSTSSLNEQGTQPTSMMPNYDSSTAINGEVNQITQNQYNSATNSITSCNSYDYTTDPNTTGFQLGHTAGNPAGSGGVYIQMPYGMYATAAAPAPPPLPYPTFVGPPPAFAGPSLPQGAPSNYIAAPTTADIAENGEALVHFQGMSYPTSLPPPPMSFFYSPTTACNSSSAMGGCSTVANQKPVLPQICTSGGSSAIANVAMPMPPTQNSLVPPQGYWCLPPQNNAALPTQQLNGTTMSNMSCIGNSNLTVEGSISGSTQTARNSAGNEVAPTTDRRDKQSVAVHKQLND